MIKKFLVEVLVDKSPYDKPKPRAKRGYIHPCSNEDAYIIWNDNPTILDGYHFYPGQLRAEIEEIVGKSVSGNLVNRSGFVWYRIEKGPWIKKTYKFEDQKVFETTVKGI